jgi:hypothetical protein
LFIITLCFNRFFPSINLFINFFLSSFAEWKWIDRNVVEKIIKKNYYAVERWYQRKKSNFGIKKSQIHSVYCLRSKLLNCQKCMLCFTFFVLSLHNLFSVSLFMRIFCIKKTEKTAGHHIHYSSLLSSSFKHNFDNFRFNLFFSSMRAMRVLEMEGD